MSPPCLVRLIHNTAHFLGGDFTAFTVRLGKSPPDTGVQDALKDLPPGGRVANPRGG